MKKVLLTFAVFFAFIIVGNAQQAMPLPLDPNVRIGVLDNGMTYYIRHNEKPAQRAEFYIAQKVGAILEEENQRGLAHFLEHMAFNGTKNYPGKAMLDYLERNGVKFGENVNAYTGVEQTVYLLTNVPTTNPGLVDSCLLVLHDWSSYISLETEEIDAERGVILEELRTREDASQRMMKHNLEAIYPNSPYATRLPGGLPEVVANFSYQTLRDYYHKWYRPDLQGIIIVGDIDVDKIEKRIKEMFADIKAPVNPAERTRFQVADNAEPIVTIASDKEATGYNVMMFYKQDVFPKEFRNDASYWMQNYVLNLISQMYINRLQEIAQKPTAPFTTAYGYYGSFYISETKDAWTCVVAPKDATNIEPAIATLIEENNRMKQFGFTASEYERVKADYMKHVESQYQDRENQKNSAYVDECLNNFLSNEPMMGIENEFQFLQQIAPMLPLEAINQVAQQLVSDSNFVIAMTAPIVEGVTLPTETELLAMVTKAENNKVEAYAETLSNEPLIAQMPKAGKVVKTTELPEFEATQWTLKNGMRVIYKPTKFKEDEIRMSAYSWGGNSVLNKENLATWKALDDVIDLGGLGNFSAIDLQKVLAGKKANVSPFIAQDFEGMRGDCSVKDLETMMQLIYLYFTNPRSDKDAFDSFIARTKAQLQNMGNHPMITFQDSLNAVMYDNNALAGRLTLEEIDQIDYNLAMDMYKQRFADPNNFVFTFVGNIDPATFKPLVEQYLGSLKKQKRKENWQDFGLNISNKSRSSVYERAMENPKTTVYLIYNGKMDYTAQNNMNMEVLNDILDIVYTKSIREDEGGTYGVGVSGQVSPRPQGNFFMYIGFDTNNEAYAKLKAIAERELENIAKNGPAPETLQKVKEFKIKNHKEKMAENSYWLGSIVEKDRNGVNRVENYDEMMNAITVQTIADFAKQVISQNKKAIIQKAK